jgi:hypothetical protein
MSVLMKSTTGEIIIAMFIAGVAAVLAVVAGFLGGIWICGVVFSGEATESALIMATATAIVFGIAVFICLPLGVPEIEYVPGWRGDSLETLMIEAAFRVCGQLRNAVQGSSSSEERLA